MSQWGFRNKISLHIVIIVLVISIFVSASFGIVKYYDQVKETRKSLISQSEIISGQLVEILKSPVYNFDKATVLSICRAAFSEKALSIVQIKDNGFDIIDFAVARVENRITEVESLIFPDNLILLNSQILYNNEILGTLTIGITTKYADREINSYLKSILIQIIIQTLILSTLLYYFLQKFFVKPLIDIIDVTSKISEGVYSNKILTKNNNELGLLAKSISQMQENICQNIKSLEDENKQRRKVEVQLKKSSKEKEILLNEIHHRVKNNLAVIISLLNVQASMIKNKEQALIAFEESQHRIYSMALIHELLYISNNFERIRVKDYIENILQYLEAIYLNNKNIEKEVDLEDLFVDLNYAVPLGIILNEVITNMYKHAFKNKESGNILIKFINRKKSGYLLEISDDGNGFPCDFNYRESDTMGLTMINSLIEQIQGSLEIHTVPESGTKFSITFDAVE